MPPVRIMRELPRIRLLRGTRSVAGMAEFLGRPHELELVRGALARARTERRPTAVVVDGEPGVGKSRLIEEASKSARVVAASRPVGASSRTRRSTSIPSTVMRTALPRCCWSRVRGRR